MRAARGSRIKAVYNAVIANPYSKTSEVATFLNMSSANASHVLCKLYKQGKVGRKKCRYYAKQKANTPAVKPTQLELELPMSQERPVVEAPEVDLYSSRVITLSKEVHDLQVKLLDQAAVIKYLEQRLGVTRG
jgi:hypothetical protein